MKNRLFMILILTILLTPVLSMAQGESVPKIYIENDKYDAGEVIEGTIINHTFTIYNRGKETLRINKIKPG